MEFKTTERGAKKLLKDSYICLFKKHCKWNNECELKRKGELEELDNFVEQVNEHTHPRSAK